jgi:hypothetical protein
VSGKDLDFDALMAQMGVRKLDEAGGSARQRSRAKPARTEPRKSRAPQKAGGSAAPKASAPSRKRSPGSGSRPRSTGSASPARLELRVAELERVLTQERERVRGLEAQLAAAEAARQDALTAQQEAQERADAKDHAHRAVQRRLSALQADASQPVSLARRLRERGLRGPSEAALLVRTLDEVGRLPELLELLAERPGEDLAAFLDERVALLGDCAACPVPEGRAVVRLARERCEVCGGADIRREVRLLEDECLLHGLRRVTIVGGSPKYRRQLKQLFTDPRVSVRLQAGNVRVTSKKARQVMEGSDLVVIWGATILDHSVSDLYQVREGDRARLVRLAVRGIGRMIQSLRAQLQSQD